MSGGSCNRCSSCSYGDGDPLAMEHPAWVRARLIEESGCACLKLALIIIFRTKTKYKTAIFI
jgi:hypothetical protein